MNETLKTLETRRSCRKFIADKSASTAIYDGSLVMGNLLNAAESR